jgi:Right handed beta helix region
MAQVLQLPGGSLSKASGERFEPGDRILLRRGCVWKGTFEPKSSGTSVLPIVVSAYGFGALPRIVGEDAPAMALRDVSGGTIEDLDLTQIGQAPQPVEAGNKSGKDLDPNSDQKMKAVVDVRALGPAGVRACGGTCTVSDIKLEDLVVHDGQWDGIYIGAGYQNADENTFGYVTGLLIQDVESRGNQSSGIAMAGTFTKNVSYELTNVRVLDSLLYDNGGDGLMVGQADHALIQGNRCAYNGRIRNASVGCWAWDSKNVTIQFNEADHNMTPLTNSNASDGGGFDLDLGSVDSVMQYNL